MRFKITLVDDSVNSGNNTWTKCEVQPREIIEKKQRFWSWRIQQIKKVIKNFNIRLNQAEERICELDDIFWYYPGRGEKRS